MHPAACKRPSSSEKRLDEASSEVAASGLKASAQSVVIDDKDFTVVNFNGQVFVPLNCLLDWCSISEQELVAVLRDFGCEIFEQTDANVAEFIRNAMPHLNEIDERLIPLEGAIAYLKILGLIYEANSVERCLINEGLLSEDDRILRQIRL